MAWRKFSLLKMAFLMNMNMRRKLYVECLFVHFEYLNTLIAKI